jgi:hypothetical protein
MKGSEFHTVPVTGEDVNPCEFRAVEIAGFTNRAVTKSMN